MEFIQYLETLYSSSTEDESKRIIKIIAKILIYYKGIIARKSTPPELISKIHSDIIGTYEASGTSFDFSKDDYISKSEKMYTLLDDSLFFLNNRIKINEGCREALNIFDEIKKSNHIREQIFICLNNDKILD